MYQTAPRVRASTYRQYLIGRSLSHKTLRQYERELSRLTDWCADRALSLHDLDPDILRGYADTLPNSTTVRTHLRSALNHWWAWQGIDGFPGAIVVPKRPPMVCKALEPADAKAIVKASFGWWRPGTAVLIGAFLGLRNEEIATLRWDCFDGGMDWVTVTGKFQRTRRLAVEPELKTELAGRRNGSPYVFEGSRGRAHVTHATICNWVKLVAVEAGVEEDVWPHRLRHTFGASANDETGDLRSVQTAMGHSRPETTAGYTRTTADRLRGVSKAVARAYLD